MTKKLISILCCFILIFTMSACKKEEPAIASLDGENIDEAYFKYYFSVLKEKVQELYGEDSWQNATLEGKPALEYVRERALHSTVEDKIVMLKAKEDGITLSAEDKQNISSNKQQWINSYGSESKFVEGIKNSYGLSEEQFDYMLEAVYYREHLTEKYVNDEKTHDYYNNSIVKVKHILIPTVELNSNIPLTADELKNAEEKLTKVLDEINKGTDFDKLVAEYTEDQDTFYYVGEGYALNADGSMGSGMVEEFETASFSLDAGEISGVVESPYGYHIIKRYENDDDMYNLSKETLASMLFMDVLEGWKSQKELVINESVYNSYK